MTTRVICVGLAVVAVGYAAARWYARRRARRLIESWPDRRRQILAEAAAAFAQAPPEP
jgi:hypothetical protein